MTAAGGEGEDVLRTVHHHPGRLRLRSAAFVGGGAAASRAIDALLAAGARRVELNGLTGSLLIEYEHEPDAPAEDALVACAARAAGLRTCECDPGHPERCHGERILGAARRINAATHALTGHRIELRTLVPAALAGVSVLSLAFGRGPALPRWDNLAYWSVSLFALLHSAEINAAARETERHGASPR